MVINQIPVHNYLEDILSAQYGASFSGEKVYKYNNHYNKRTTSNEKDNIIYLLQVRRSLRKVGSHWAVLHFSKQPPHQ